jgi:aquaglyceroporin related protein
MASAIEPLKTRDFANDENQHLEFAPSQAPTTSDTTTGNSHEPSHRTSSSLRRTRSLLGLHPLAPIDEDHDTQERQKLLWSRIRIVLREPFVEFWGTFILVMFGDGSVAQVLLSTGQTTAPGGNGFGPYQSISWG